jgi:hypothetical protein
MEYHTSCQYERVTVGWCGGYAVALLLIHGGLVAWNDIRTSPTRNELGHLVAGLIAWRLGDFGVYHVNPPLPRLVASLPMALTYSGADPIYRSAGPPTRREWSMRDEFVKINGPAALQYLVWARWICIPFSLLGGFLCYHWTRQLFGPAAGVLALTMWSFAPPVFAMSATICAELPAATVCLCAVYFFWQWLRDPFFDRAIVAGLMLGLAGLCKFTLLVLYLSLPAVWFVYRLRGRSVLNKRDWLRQGMMLAMIVVTSVYAINCGYLFEGTGRLLEDFRFQSMLFTGCKSLDSIPREGANRFAESSVGKVALPLPANFIQGIDTQRYDFERGLPSYMRGQWADHGWWHYYLYALAVKEPLGTWCLLLLAIGMTVFDCVRAQPSPSIRVATVDGGAERPSPSVPLPKGERRACTWREEVVVLVPGLAILIFVSSQTGFSVHSRYVIPSLPFFFIWISKLGRVFERRPRPLSQRERGIGGRSLSQGERGVAGWLRSRRQPAMAVVVVLALVWSVGSSLSIYPHSLSYFNELAAILPTPADASYPKPTGASDGNRDVWSKIKSLLSAGPRNGPRHLLDSNIDWGQDLFYLKEWLDAHPEAKLDGLAYWSSYPATLARVREVPMPPSRANSEEILRRAQDDGRDGKGDRRGARDDVLAARGASGPKPGWYALSVSYIYGRDRQYRYFLNFEPVAMAGYSIYIYLITLEEANRVRKQLGLPALKAGG